MAVKKRSVNTITIKWIVIAGVIFLLTAGFVWYKRIYLNPENVFWGTIENNLVTNGLTRQVGGENEAQSSSQYTRLQTGSQKASELLEVTRQNGSGTLVIRQTIGTTEADYARYAKITTDKKDTAGNPVDYSSVEGVWGRAEAESGGQTPSQAFNQAILGTIPTAKLSYEQRQKLIKTMRETNVFNIDFSQVAKQDENGRKLYVYDVQINAEPYFAMMRQFLAMVGLDSSIVPDPANYKDVPPLELKISIRPTARQLAKLNYLANGQEETYSGYGQNGPITVPKETIPLIELQQRIQKLQ